MKIKFFTLALLFCNIFTIAAQEFTPKVGYSSEPGYKTTFKKNKFKDNWFISAGVGAGILFGDQNDKASFKDRLNTNPHLAVGKWVNPYFGMRAYFSGGVLHGFEGNNAEFMQHNKFVAGHLDFMYDITNHLGTYNEKRVFRVIPWIGMGYAQRFKNQDISRTESPSLNTGILLAFRLCNRIDLNLEAQGYLLNEQFNRVDIGKLSDGIVQVSAGLTYKLGKTTFEVAESMDYALLNELNDQINQLRAQNEELSLRPEFCPECPQVSEPVQVKKQYGENLVHFRIGSSKIEKDQEANIYNAAKHIKEAGTAVKVKVTGYADKKTGTPGFNMQLSEKRAKAVGKMLTEKYDVPSGLITLDWSGSEEQPFEENNWNRIVIITISE
ncbi:MAG: OmpA family protein [Tannerellaceae bacterium]|nr:OmpA family protein [Tannerellaceae bacterium]